MATIASGFRHAIQWAGYSTPAAVPRSIGWTRMVGRGAAGNSSAT